MQSYNRNSQEKIVFNSFYLKPQTMKEVEVCTGIDRAYIFRYVSKLRKKSKIQRLKTVYCSITKSKAGLLTTDPKLFSNKADVLQKDSTTVEKYSIDNK